MAPRTLRDLSWLGPAWLDLAWSGPERYSFTRVPTRGRNRPCNSLDCRCRPFFGDNATLAGLSCSRRNKNIAAVFLAASVRDVTEQNYGTPDLHFKFWRQAPVAPCDFSRERLQFPISAATGVTSSSVYDLACALISRGIGRITPRSSTNLHHAHCRRRSTNCANASRNLEITGDEQWL